MDLNLFSGTLTNQQAVVTAHGFHDVGCELVTCDTDALIANDTRQGDHGDSCGTTSDVDDHVAGRLFYIDTDTEGRRHRFMNHKHFAGP